MAYHCLSILIRALAIMRAAGQVPMDMATVPKLSGGVVLERGLTPFLAPTKGYMYGLTGDTWTFSLDLSEAESMDFLPDAQLEFLPDAQVEAVINSYKHLKDYARWRTMFSGGYYSSGKIMQKVGTVCLLLEKFIGLADDRTQECVGWLSMVFKCLYDKASLPGSEYCQNAPKGSYHDQVWGGIASKDGWDDPACGADFGNACYNDHHYHFGYFVTAAAILAKLEPSFRSDALFIDYVNTLLRDTANPSSEDTHFTRFRMFDWFDMHSWSHGLTPMNDGKDQESTSEEINLVYGMYLWGKTIGNLALQQLGATMLTLTAKSTQNYFLLKTGNPNHHPDFVKNHVTGIFFQNKVHYTTWFGSDPVYIHGIQMMPLSPAVTMTRTVDYCSQEWNEILRHVKMEERDNTWRPILLTGSLAMVEPKEAWKQLSEIDEEDALWDSGLSKAWALYWTATRLSKISGKSISLAAAPIHVKGNSRGLAQAQSLLVPISTDRPNAQVFEGKSVRPFHNPAHTEVKGPKASNKFWVNWVVESGEEMAIFPMPYALKWGNEPGKTQLEVSHNLNQHQVYGSGDPGKVPSDRMEWYMTNFIAEFVLGAKEEVEGGYVVVKEDLFGIHVAVRGPQGTKRSITFPIFSGMPYVSALYEGGFTPTVSHPHGIANLHKVKNGVWSFRNRRDAEFRVYVLDKGGQFVDETYDFNNEGQLSKPLQGWVRIAHVLADGDKEVLDAHAEAIVVGCTLEVEAGGTVRYVFQKAAPTEASILHMGYGHHVDYMVETPANTTPANTTPVAAAFVAAGMLACLAVIASYMLARILRGRARRLGNQEELQVEISTFSTFEKGGQ